MLLLLVFSDLTKPCFCPPSHIWTRGSAAVSPSPQTSQMKLHSHEVLPFSIFVSALSSSLWSSSTCPPNYVQLIQTRAAPSPATPEEETGGEMLNFKTPSPQTQINLQPQTNLLQINSCGECCPRLKSSLQPYNKLLHKINIKLLTRSERLKWKVCSEDGAKE